MLLPLVHTSTHKQPVLEIIQNKKVIYKRPPTAPDLHQ
jgi:hypothetical protein